MDIREYQKCLDLLEKISVDFDTLGDEDDDKMKICEKIKELCDDVFRRL